MASVVGKHRLTSVTGLAALGLDALASCAYGPEAIVLALAVAGVAGIQLTFGVTLMLVALLLVLVLCYRQVIMAYPDGGGAYTVSRRNLVSATGSPPPPRWWSTTCSTSRCRSPPASPR